MFRSLWYLWHFVLIFLLFGISLDSQCHPVRDVTSIRSDSKRHENICRNEKKSVRLRPRLNRSGWFCIPLSVTLWFYMCDRQSYCFVFIHFFFVMEFPVSLNRCCVFVMRWRISLKIRSLFTLRVHYFDTRKSKVSKRRNILF